MRVLFAPDSKNTSEQSGIRIEKMIKALHQPGNRIGILTEAPNLNKRFKDLIYLNDISEINEADWDIVLVQNNFNLRSIAKKVRKRPILFISNSSRKKDQFINLPNLYQIIAIGKDIYATYQGIPSEFIESISIPVYEPYKISAHISEQREHFKLVYFISENDVDLKVSRSVIKAVNYIPYACLTVVSSSENISLLQEIANDNITFRPYKGSTHGKYFCGHDVVLVSEELAVTAVLSKRPVIVVGVNGLGGLVCSDNLPGFMRTGFKGRIGGTYYEDIPVGLLDYEIRYALGIEEEKKTPFIDEAGYSSLKKYHADNWKKRFLKLINTNVCLYQYLANKKMIVKLVPGIPENIFLQHLKENNEMAIINKLSGKLIGSVGKEEALIIKSCNGTATIESIIEEHTGSSARDIIDFILQLWQNKVLILSLP